MTEKKIIRVGLVGVGNWARYGHIPALRLLPEFEIVAVSSRSKAKAEETASAFKIPYAFDDVQALASHPEVDLVAVLSPPPEHASAVKAAIAAGKDVYCEWPLTTNTRDSEELLSLAQAAGVRHVVGLQRTLGASAQYLRDLLAGGYVGRLRSVRMHVSMEYFGPTRSAALEWTVHAGYGKTEITSVPTAMTLEDIRQTTADFRHAANVARDAGFDGVQIQGGFVYLFQQFLQENLNLRTDAYGGTIENRARLLFEVLTSHQQL